MKRNMLTVFCAMLFALFVVTASDVSAATKENAWDSGKVETEVKGAFTFYSHPSKDGKEAWIYKIGVKEGKKSKSLSIPKNIRGKKVTRLGIPDDPKSESCVTLFGGYIEPWHDVDGNFGNKAMLIQSIKIPDTVEVIEASSFSGLDSVKTIKLPKKVKEIGDYTFYGCNSLKTIILPDNLKKIDNSSLWDCPSLKNIKISQKNKTFQVKGNCLLRKKDKALICAVAVGKDFVIPDGTKKIVPFAFNNATSPTIHIPSSVTKIEQAAFEKQPLRQNINIKDVTVSTENPVFARDGQCIYKKSDKSLAVAIPDEKGELRISDMVEKLTPEMSMVNCDTAELDYLEKLVYPKNLKYVTVPGFSRIKAKNVYFTGSVPAEVKKPKSATGFAKLPIFCHVYVPEAYTDVYKAWYKQNKCYSSVNGWHTYNPKTGL